MSYTKQTVVVACDVGPDIGIGHLMRCIALAEALRSRGARVVFAADAERVPLAAEQLQRRGFESAPSLTDQSSVQATLRNLDTDLVVIDSYLLPTSTYSSVRSAGYPVIAIVDYEIGDREADLYLDQNIGAENDCPAIATGARRLAGLRYVLLRDEITGARPAGPRREVNAERPTVFGYFGGTDPTRVAPAAARALVATGAPFDATLVGASADLRSEIAAIRPRDDQHLEAIPPTTHIAEYVTAADAVISAAGTSAWELLCLGAATGLVCVTDNQRAAYRRAHESDAAVGVATANELIAHDEAAITRLHTLLTDTRLREQLRVRGMRLVDGEGRQRVADAAADLLAPTTREQVS